MSTQEKHFRGRTARPQISPLRCAPVGMTRGRAVLPGSVVSEWVAFFVAFTGEVMGLRPTQADEMRLLFSSHCLCMDHPPLCHLDRSAAQWRDLRSTGPSWECVSTERSEP